MLGVFISMIAVIGGKPTFNVFALILSSIAWVGLFIGAIVCVISSGDDLDGEESDEEKLL